MKSITSLTFALAAPLFMTSVASAQSLTINGTSYTNYFGPAANVTVTTSIPSGTVLSVVTGGTKTGTLNTYWSGTANGGAVLGSNVLGEVRVSDTGAQVALTGNSLQFNVSNNPTSLLGSLGTGVGGLGLNWSATSKFTGSQLILAPNTTYQVAFDVNGSNGLLNSTLGLLPTFNVSLLDGTTAVGTSSSGSLVNILGLSLTPVLGGATGDQHAVVNFVTGNTVSGTAASLKFGGSATLPATALGLGTNFATISNISIAAVPEPSTLALAMLGSFALLRRRRN